MIALGAAEEPDLALISRTELAEPPDSKIVLALGTLDLDSRHSIYPVFLIIHDHDLLFLALSLVFHLVSNFNLTDIAAFPALQLPARRN